MIPIPKLLRSLPVLFLAMAPQPTLGACAGGADEGCAPCLEEKCSDLDALCREHEDCACMSDCMAADGVVGVPDCLGTCGLDAFPPGFATLEQCVAVACPDSGDECSTPADWEPTAPEQSAEPPPPTDSLVLGEDADCAFEEGLPDGPDVEVFQLESEDGQVCLRLGRTNMGPGNLANTEWRLDDARVGTLGSVLHLEASAESTEPICWYSSHHNFADLAHLATPTLHLDLELREDGHGGPREYFLHVFEGGPAQTPETCAPTTDGTSSLGGPIVLVPWEP